MTTSKPKILIWADRPEWAYHYIANFIIEQLSDRYDFSLDFYRFYRENSYRIDADFLHKILGNLRYLKRTPQRRKQKAKWSRVRQDNNYDIVLYFDMLSFLTVAKYTRTSHNVVCFYTDVFPPYGIVDKTLGIPELKEKFFKNIDVGVCGNENTLEMYGGLDIPLYITNASLDCEFFRLTPKEINRSKKFVVGWSGDSNKKAKRYFDFIVPAVEAAAKLRPGIELKKREFGSRETLPRFYDDLDVVAIGAIYEGGPALFGEAACSDVPCISTRVGWPQMVIEDGVNGFLVDDPEEMTARLVQLYDDRELLFSASTRIRADFCKQFGLKTMRERWIEVFETALGNR